MSDVIIESVVSRVRIVEGAGGLSEQTVRCIVAALLPAVQQMLAHQRQVSSETSTRNGYLDWMEGETGPGGSGGSDGATP
ncbi:hypothetical protein [Cupriavidus oxalaticus]|uniref:hypothetical protein n=1 Tax=Cupriavidus oxalaticus TaxID=96344 RepID=UPI003180A348